MIELTNKITPEFLDTQIVAVKYERLTDTLTHCRIIVKSGFTFTGESACIDPANYDETIGKKIAYDNAFDKMWGAYGFWLSQKRYEIDPNFADSLDYTVAMPDTADVIEETYQMTGKEKFTLEVAVALAQSGEYVRNIETGATLNPEDVSPVALWQLVPDDELLADETKEDNLMEVAPQEVDRTTFGLDFGQALLDLKNGKKVARKGWNGKGMFLFIVHGYYLTPVVNETYEVTYGSDGDRIVSIVSDAIYMKTADNMLVPWLASQTDVLADDWVVVN